MSNSEEEDFDSLAESLVLEVLRFNPALATELGLHEYDALMPRMGRDEVTSFVSKLEDFYSKLLSIDKSKLGADKRVDYEVVSSFIETTLVKLRDWGLWRFYPIGFDACLSALLRLYLADHIPSSYRLRALRSRVRDLEHSLRMSMECVEDRYKPWMRLAITTLLNIGGVVKEVLDLARREEDRELEELCRRSFDALKSMIENLGEALRSSKPGFKPMGRDLYNKLLKAMRIGMDAEALLKLGYSEVEKLRALMKNVAEELGYGSVERALRSVRTWYGIPPREAAMFFRIALAQLRIFCERKGLVELPRGERAEVIELLPHLRGLAPFAIYVAPDIFGEDMRGRVLLTSLDESLAEVCDYLTILNTAAHEAYPGHHVQFLYVKRSKSFVRKILSFPPDFIEGWAHYGEWLVMEKELVDDPRYKLVVYRDSLWRAMRMCIDVELGLGLIGVEDAVEKLVNEAFVPRPLAEADAYRHLTNPGTQVGYCYGKLRILELRENVRRLLGERYSDSLFHEMVLEEGPLPLSILSELVMDKAKRMLAR